MWTFAIAALVHSPLSAATKIVNLKVELKRAGAYEISVQYPRTGLKAADDVLGQFAKAKLADYKSGSPDRGSEEPAYSYELGYSVERNDNQVLAILFSESTYTGGAHPNGYFYAFNFLMPDGAQIFLPEIVDGRRGIARVSEYAVRDLTSQLGDPDAMTDDSWIRRGAGPLATNLDIFVLQPKYIDIQFPAYQVAAYAAGPQEVKVPLSYLKGYLRKDWRKPQPSFACARTTASLEVAICADAALARMDRQAAEQYAANLANAYEKTAAEKWRSSQRDWLASRNKACDHPGPEACLRKSYAARIKALKVYSP